MKNDCERCTGTGITTDAAPGDMFYNEYKCPDCIDYKKAYEAAMRILSSIFPDKFNGYFITGEYGEHDSLGLPDGLFVCAQYGSDAVIRYEKCEES